MTLQGFKRRKNFVEENSEITSDNQMNWWIRHRDSNGLSESGALVKAANQWSRRNRTVLNVTINQ